MITDNKKTSLLVEQQLPEFVRDNPDYQNFGIFVKAYYEWMESANVANSSSTTANSYNQGVTYGSKNILNYKDVDETIDDFQDYFVNEFLQNFPAESLVSKAEATKIAKELYQSKGTISSYQFLFRVLFNSEFEVFNTKDAVLKASDGVWYVAKSLKLKTTDSVFRNIDNYRIFGVDSLSIATVEKSVLAGNKTEVFISNIERLFHSGETARILDKNNQFVLGEDGQPIEAKIVGQVSQLNVNPAYRGLLYETGDPVIVYNGLVDDNGVGATAEVGETTAGSITSIGVVDGGYGYTFNPQSLINIKYNNTGAKGAKAEIVNLNPDYRKRAEVTLVGNNTIGVANTTHLNATNYTFLSQHPSANVNSRLVDALSFATFTTYPIASVLVTNGGGGITKVPTITASSLYANEFEETPTADVSKMGILAPIQITDGGHGYRANDKIVFTGGKGYGAFANVITVSANGAVTNVAYVYDSTLLYPLGGLGYDLDDLPLVHINSANVQASNASIYVPGILGKGAEFSVTVDRAGSVTTINLIDPGEDYVSTPNVSLKVQDIVVSNVSIANFPRKGDIIFQGTDANNFTYKATVNSASLLQPYNNPEQSVYELRVFNYNSNPNPRLPLKIDRNINFVMANTQWDESYNRYGYKNYGDGSAKASAKFLNGLVVSQGQYLTAQGQPSSYDVLQNEVYNNYTYQITVSKEIAKYRNVLLNLLHPSGTKVIGRMSDRTETYFNPHMQEAVYSGRSFASDMGGIGTYGAQASITTDYTNKSSNIVKFHYLSGANIAEIIFAGTTYLELVTDDGDKVKSLVKKVNHTNDTVTLESNTWLTFSNVAHVTGNTGANGINITYFTGRYDMVNNGNYSNTAHPLLDIVRAGDTIMLADSVEREVDYVDYYSGNGIIHLTENLDSDFDSLLDVRRNFVANSTSTLDGIRIFGPVGTTYIPELVTESGVTLITEDGKIILLG
jgi:hypothetical protein